VDPGVKRGAFKKKKGNLERARPRRDKHVSKTQEKRGVPGEKRKRAQGGGQDLPEKEGMAPMLRIGGNPSMTTLRKKSKHIESQGGRKS